MELVRDHEEFYKISNVSFIYSRTIQILINKMWSLHSHLGSYYLCSSLGNEGIFKFDDFICIQNMKYMKFLISWAKVLQI